MKTWVRQAHRWMAVLFTVTVVATTVAITAGGESLLWVSYTPLLPLAVLFFSGLYLYLLPYRAKRRHLAGNPVT
ncbi:hypothetical protein Aab01nite_29260 [Paractinoplanes abujensis]|uniref:Uncharacterized protein n=1 Tax=Paractinoplanes abujensis TaxID=882441 RepID=A0A7W7D3A6_9ACTN|nr:hypothetical protein [Actinoplanes abujensis]MBB4698178.1 hypothetical protein [Actinoplanes abujensis]GID19336.1 hypothetical protein Aab01nite_29260 [Actinoplanes abujensis]